jgi:DNA processing protein
MDKLRTALAVSGLSFLRAGEKKRLFEAAGGPNFFRSLSLSDVELIIGRAVPRARFLPEEALRAADLALDRVKACGLSVLLCGDDSYPEILREIYDPPFAVFVRGDLSLSGRPTVAVVGTRRPTGAGLAAAYELGQELAKEGAVVVSGLALGIDAAAHRGAVDAGGTAVAVFGSGVDRVYPASNRRLASEILTAGGAFVSEYLPGTEALKHHFPARNRIISGLSTAVVVVEAPEKSGSLITADFALDQGREVFVHSVGAESDYASGSAALVADGAEVITSAGDVLAREPSNDRRTPGGYVELFPEPEASSRSRDAGSRLADLLRAELEGRIGRNDPRGRT